jgi:UPF0716 protein FxsA
MGYVLFAAFVGIPIIEIAVFISVGGRIGLWPTLAIIVATAAAGSWLLRIQGLATLQRAQATFQRGEVPVAEVFDGLCLLLAGALLLTPGFVTDTIGFLLFLPPIRHFLARRAWQTLSARGGVHIHTTGGAEPGPHPQDGSGPTVIEGEFEEVGPDKDGDDDRRK